jgi:aspartyl protease family protein
MPHKSFKLLLFIALIILGLFSFNLLPRIIEKYHALDSYDVSRLFFLLAFIAFLTYSFWHNRGSESSLPSILLWITIFAVVIIGYAFRFELGTLKERVMAVLLPSHTWTNEKGELVIARENDGHFYINVYGATNQKTRFLIDTGATDVALTKEDAIKLGINVDNLQYTRTYNTANGPSKAAPVKIPVLTIGKKSFYNVDGHVSKVGMDISLLGMSVIDNFSNFTITKDMLILKY